MKHILVHRQAGMFYGWPANSGIWAWGDEIVVGFTESSYRESQTGHSMDHTKPCRGVIARSMDGGESWSIERPDKYPQGFSFGGNRSPGFSENHNSPASLDFSDPDLSIRVQSDCFLISHDRCHNWEGPYLFPNIGSTDKFTARTDYIPLSKSSCLFFVSAKEPGVRGGPFTDRAFCIRTDDGGRTFQKLGYMLPEKPEVRSVMPSTVKIGEDILVSALRRRFDGESQEGPFSDCWIDVALSKDLGRTWCFSSKVADTHNPESRRNGNPASLVELADRRLCVVYGFRAPEFGIRAKISGDRGITWGKEILLRSDASSWDMGYPRSALRTDGRVISIYYYTTEENKEQHIAATIWDPEEMEAYHDI